MSSPRRSASSPCATVSYGVTSDPIREDSCGSLFAAVGCSIKEPWRVIGVDLRGCSVEDRDGYPLRQIQLRATREEVVVQNHHR